MMRGSEEVNLQQYKMVKKNGKKHYKSSENAYTKI